MEGARETDGTQGSQRPGAALQPASREGREGGLGAGLGVRGDRGHPLAPSLGLVCRKESRSTGEQEPEGTRGSSRPVKLGGAPTRDAKKAALPGVPKGACFCDCATSPSGKLHAEELEWVPVSYNLEGPLTPACARPHARPHARRSTEGRAHWSLLCGFHKLVQPSPQRSVHPSDPDRRGKGGVS